MAIIGWSLILASLVFVAIRRPPFIETLIALCRGLPSIQQPPSTRSPSAAATDDTSEDTDQGRSSGVSVALQGVSARKAGAGSSPRPKAPSPEAEVTTMNTPTDAETPVIAIASSPPESPQTTPKAEAANGASANDPVPSFSLSPSTTTATDTPASAAAVARASANSMMPPPSLSTPSSLMAPPPRPPKLNKLDVGPSSSSFLSAPQTRPSPLPNRLQQTQYDRQPGTSTLAPPPTHSTKPSKPSRKVTLEPGHSPLDWARLANHPTSDLRNLGPGATYLRVTPSMLKRQTGRRGKDAWTALGGRVYNMSPYLPFHPGGEPELLRAAGRDGTRLFGEIHPWVNYETMLSSCLIGLLVDESEGESTGDMEAMD